MINKPKGTYDIYGKEAEILNYINAVVADYAKLYNYDYIRTPIFESSELFHRSVGETSDIVTKETYDFQDRGERNITLRPEGTAGVVRSFIENKMYGNRNDPIKLYYFGTMYRYERPQSGRNREFTQAGVEAFGSNDPLIDAEVISLGYNILHELGIEELTVELNSLGDKESRANYTKALVDYLKPHINDLCEDCQKRYKTNPLRIIDCKYDANSDILKNIPLINYYLNEESKNRFKQVLDLLKNLDIDFSVNPKIVRGLDYYDHTVFEYITDESNVTIGGGGRYNNLIKELDGPDTPAIGFALGIERISKEIENLGILKSLDKIMDVYVMSVNEEEKFYALKIAQDLRLNGIKTEINTNNLSLKSQFKVADDLQAKFLIILNSEDLQKGMVTVKDNYTKEEIKIDEAEIIEYLFGNL